MTKQIEDYTVDELSAKINAIKAEREKTANALRRYEEELERRKQEVPLGVPCDGEFYVARGGAAMIDREGEEETSKLELSPLMTREELLKKAAETVCGSREQAHGNPHGTFERIAKAWSAYLGVELTAADVAVMMILFKTARLKGNPKHEDSWVDIAGYAACGAEIAEEERNEKDNEG